MKKNTMRPASRSPRAGSLPDGGQEYVEFKLDEATAARVRALAREARCTPFAMCVGLLEESVSLREQRA